MGRPKQERPTNANVASKVLARVHAEETWVALVQLEQQRLGIAIASGKLIVVGKKKDPATIDAAAGQVIPSAADQVIDGPDYQGRFSILPLMALLRYLEDRAYGRPTENVNHMHDKPIEHTHTVELGEGMKTAMQKAESRLLEFRRG